LNLRKLPQTAIISNLWVSYFTFVFSWKCKTILFTNK